MRITQRAARTGTLVLVVAGLGGAVLHSLPEPADHAVRPTVERDLDTWSMPLDGYAQPGWSEVGYAEALLDEPCLRDLGIDSPVPWATLVGLQADSISDETPVRGNDAPALAWSRPLRAEAAAERGYQRPSARGANRDGWRQRSEDPEWNAAFDRADRDAVDRCFRASRRTLGTDDDGAAQGASTTAKRLTFLAADAARREPAVVAAAGRWRTCLAPVAPGALPEEPSGMPTGAMRQAFGTRGPALPVSDAETAFAEHDVACQESSGYRWALYDAQWSRLLHVTASDAAVLDAVRPDQVAVAERVAATIERLAPPAPEGVD
ncbi:hypothetical protein [Curtobacterium sp. ME26]|uniref:hypothetical protein n=1 Tax=Curtobacterium sp. ME26 TaxID=2744254 RepID=UPI0015F6AD16|nr:hypothetical protein [Curtobacterium sp. ME26]